MHNVIRITQEDIELGDPDSVYGCAIGRALRNYGIEPRNLTIDTERIVIGDVAFKCPKNLSKFQEDGMNGKRQRPMSFKISDLKPVGIDE